MDERGISQRELAKLVGVSHVSVHQWRTDTATPSKDRLSKLCAVFHVPVGWLLYGDEMPLADSSMADGKYLSIPVLSQCAGCGTGVLSEDMSVVQLIRVAKEWFTRKASGFTSLRNLHIVVASGDSMEPTVSDGDFVVIDSGQKTISTDAVYCLCYGDGIYLKRIQRHPNGHILLISDNSKYRPIELAEQDNVNVIGRVVLAFNVHNI
jgi:SOS-response transcriptional repressor LexA